MPTENMTFGPGHLYFDDTAVAVKTFTPEFTPLELPDDFPKVLDSFKTKEFTAEFEGTANIPIFKELSLVGDTSNGFGLNSMVFAWSRFEDTRKSALIRSGLSAMAIVRFPADI